MEYRMINFIKENRCLYDRSSPRFKCRSTRDSKWTELSQELGVGVPELKKRWRTLRDRYKREDKKQQQGGSQTVRWKYFKLLSFIKNFCDDSTDTVFFPKDELTINTTRQTYDHQYAETGIVTKTEMVLQSPVPSLTTCNGYTQIQVQAPAPAPTPIPTPTSTPTPTPTQTTVPPATERKKRKTQGQGSSIENTEVIEQISSLLDRAKGALQPSSMVKAFFNSMAIQVEEADLSFERFAYVQQEVLRVVNEQIRQQRQDRGTDCIVYSN